MRDCAFVLRAPVRLCPQATAAHPRLSFFFTRTRTHLSLEGRTPHPFAGIRTGDRFHGAAGAPGPVWPSPVSRCRLVVSFPGMLDHAVGVWCPGTQVPARPSPDRTGPSVLADRPTTGAAMKAVGQTLEVAD